MIASVAQGALASHRKIKGERAARAYSPEPSGFRIGAEEGSAALRPKALRTHAPENP